MHADRGYGYEVRVPGGTVDLAPGAGGRCCLGIGKSRKLFLEQNDTANISLLFDVAMSAIDDGTEGK